jgi:hypothetical protein
MGGTIGFSERPEQIWLKARWAFRQILEDVSAQYPGDTQMRETFDQAEWNSGLAVNQLSKELAERVVIALREATTGILAGTIESGIISKPYGDAQCKPNIKKPFANYSRLFQTGVIRQILETFHDKWRHCFLQFSISEFPTNSQTPPQPPQKEKYRALQRHSRVTQRSLRSVHLELKSPGL